MNRSCTLVPAVAAVIAAVTVTVPARAQYPAVDATITRITPEIVGIRHYLHQHPELGNREFGTAKLIAERLRALGFDSVQTGVAHTGVVGVLKGRRPGPIVAVRADMDALPITEETPFPFKSTVRTTYLGQEVGVSHACGHDVHVAVALGLAEVLSGMRDRLPGTVKFIFQPAEEGPPPGEDGGAKLMVAEGVLQGPTPEVIFGLHAAANMEVGKLGYTPGPALAASDQFIATLHGRGAHGAQPQLSIDPIVMAAQAIEALQTIRSRNLNPMEPAVITVGMVRGGTRWNVIPADVEFQGTVRTYSHEAQDLIEQRMREILGGITQAAGGSFELEYHRDIPVTVNDVALTERTVPSLVEAVGAANVERIPPATVAEDFSYFANEIPGFYYRLGTLKPGGTSGDHHTSTFQADDSAIPIGIKAMSYVVLDYLGRRK